jgi:hypothetical protein
MKTELLMVKRDNPYMQPYGDVAWEVFDKIRRGKPVLVTVEQPRNPAHHAKLWALATAVANFDKDFVDAEDAVEWVKLHIPNMHKAYTLMDGRLAITTRSISWAKMDQIRFGRFYDRALWLWSQKIGCDPETLLAEAEEKPLVLERMNAAPK